MNEAACGLRSRPCLLVACLLGGRTICVAATTCTEPFDIGAFFLQYEVEVQETGAAADEPKSEVQFSHGANYKKREVPTVFVQQANFNNSGEAFLAARRARSVSAEGYDPFGDVPGLNFPAAGTTFNEKKHRSGNPHHTEQSAVLDAGDETSAGGDAGAGFFRAAPPQEWIILVCTCAVLLVFDLLVLKRAPDTFNWHIANIVFWLCVAAIYNVGIGMRMGSQKALQWCSGYLLEWMLSMDNLFVFHLIFQTYKTPPPQIHKAVFVGIFGAVIMRLIFFMVVSSLLHAFGWFRWPFGLLLIWSGIEAVRGDDDDGDVQDTMLVRSLKWLFGSRIKEDYDHKGHSMFSRDEKGRLQVTLLLMVVAVLEVSDILFALDSVSAKVAQIPDQFVAFSSSVLAMYGLRAMFFVVHDLVEMFDLLKYGLGLILIFIGVELMFAHYIHLSSGVVCVLIVSVFIGCILASHVRKQLTPPSSKEDEPEEVTPDPKIASSCEPDHAHEENEPDPEDAIADKSSPREAIADAHPGTQAARISKIVA